MTARNLIGDDGIDFDREAAERVAARHRDGDL